MGEFTSEQRQILAAVLDAIVPRSADGRLPGGSEAGGVDRVASVVARLPVMAPTIEGGVAMVDDLARKRGAAGYSALDPAARVEVLRESEAADPAFVPTMTFLAYVAYYQTADVLSGLGLEARAPHPEGYSLADDDWSLLDPVRARGPIFRRPS